MLQTADEIVTNWLTGKPIVTDKPAELFEILIAEIERLRKRCASDPWWWAYSEYPDEGWSGPYTTREEAEAAAASHISEDDESPEFSFRQHANPEGCAENERLSVEIERMRALFTSRFTSEDITQMSHEDAQVNLRYASGIIALLENQLEDRRTEIERLREAVQEGHDLHIAVTNALEEWSAGIHALKAYNHRYYHHAYDPPAARAQEEVDESPD